MGIAYFQPTGHHLKAPACIVFHVRDRFGVCIHFGGIVLTDVPNVVSGQLYPLWHALLCIVCDLLRIVICCAFSCGTLCCVLWYTLLCAVV